MVCFVILHYIVLNETVNCIESILNNIRDTKKIIVVDNASPDSSGTELENKYRNNTDVIIIKTEKNLGFANGNNVGYQYAKKNLNSDFIVVMNNDMEILQENFIDVIFQSYSNYKFAILGPDIYSTKAKKHQNPENTQGFTEEVLKKMRNQLILKNKMKFLYAIKWNTLKIFHNNKQIKKTKHDLKSNYIDHVLFDIPLHGSCYVFSNDFMKIRDDCFYNKTFMYMESYILHYQAQRDGLKMMYCPDLKVYHHEDVSTDKVYAGGYQKAVFTNKCLLQSCEAFLELMEKDKKTNGK